MLRESIAVPRILKYLAVCDFTKDDMIDWMWGSLGAAIKAPIGPKLSNSSSEFEQGLKENNFPIPERRLDNTSSSRSHSRYHKQIESSPSPGNSTSKEIRLATSSGKHMASTEGQSASAPLVHMSSTQSTTSGAKISQSTLINNSPLSDPCAADPQPREEHVVEQFV